MAINFPNSPTNGQVFTDASSGNSWSWDSANTCWKSTSTYIQTITVSSTAPGSPAVGQLWWNQDFGRLLIYYNDGNSSQWVDASPSDYTSQLAYNNSNAAFGKANTALQNTSGTFAGNLSVSGNLDLSLTTSALKLPIGTTAQRPTGTDGLIRYNTSTGAPEWYNSSSSSWMPVFQQANNTTYSAGYLAVGGGGGGGGGEGNPGGDGGGGGGAGGLIESSFNLISGGVYNITIGSGGAGGVGPLAYAPGGRGTDTLIFGPGISPIIAYGGGGGGDGNGGDNATGGGSGGGAGNEYGASFSGGPGTYKQGNPGGDCLLNSTTQRGASGGGGAGSAGVTRTSNNGANGGDGLGSKISGSLLYYAGGGGGGPDGTNSAGSGGSGVGGNGATSGSASTAGTANRGSGGGGGVGHNTGNNNGAAGSSGVVIITYQNASQRGSGGTVTSYSIGGYTWWVHTFTSSGTFTA